MLGEERAEGLSEFVGGKREGRVGESSERMERERKRDGKEIRRTVSGVEDRFRGEGRGGEKDGEKDGGGRKGVEEGDGRD